jgi:UDP-2-acetamido-2-deoxy-ribo-hexuluronate aminotransferase
MIKFVDLEKQRDALDCDLNEVIANVISKNIFIMGEEVNKLEDELTNLSSANCTCVANGTDALLIALLAMGIKPGDEVIVPSFTWVSSVEVICQVGAIPVFIDILDDFNIDIKKIEAKINHRTKAIMAVSMFGRCPDLNKIQKIANKYKLFSIEDAAQSFGAKSHGNMSCSVLDISTTSFFPSKPLGCYGDGGAIFSNNEALLKKIKVIPKHGQTSRYNYVEIGINSRLDTIQAAILSEKLKIFPEEIVSRNRIAKLYESGLNNVSLLSTPYIPLADSRSVWAQYTLLLDQSIAEHRQTIMTLLKEKGIPSALYYPVPVHTSPAYKQYDSSDLSNTMDISERVLSLPMHPYLSDKEIEIICFELSIIIRALS